MVVAIFRSRLRPECVAEYRPLAAHMLELARAQPGFVSFESFGADDAARVSIIEFESLEHLDAWRNHPEHRKAQQLGRQRFYAEYRIQVCRPLRTRSFRREPIREP